MVDTMTERQVLERVKRVDLAFVVQAMAPLFPDHSPLHNALTHDAGHDKLGFELVMACSRHGLGERLAQVLDRAPELPPAWVTALREARPRLVAAAHGARGTDSFSDAAAALQSVDRALARFAAGGLAG